MTTITTYDLVRREVTYCVSSLVSTLASQYGLVTHIDASGRSTDLSDLIEQAFELASPVLDYEEAAREAGWTIGSEDGFWWAHHENEDLNDAQDCHCNSPEEAWQAACEVSNIEPYEREVFEHWIVSHWLADKLIEHGEKVDKNFQGICVWARTTTGQAIAMDYVIEQIAQELSNG